MQSAAVTPKKATALLGTSAHVALEVFPLSRLQLQPMPAKVIRTLKVELAGELLLKGYCDYLPKDCKATLIVRFLNADPQAKAGVSQREYKVKLKVTSPFSANSAFHVEAETGGKFPILDLFSLSAFGKGSLSFTLTPLFGFCEPAEKSPSELEIDLPYQVALSERGKLRLGDAIEITPPQSAIYEKYVLNLTVRQVNESADQVCHSLTWLPGERQTQVLHLGVMDNALIAKNLSGDCFFDLEYRFTLPPKPEPAGASPKPPKTSLPAKPHAVGKAIWQAPIPVLTELSATFESTRLDYWLSWAQLRHLLHIYREGDPVLGYRIKVKGLFSQLHPGLLEKIEASFAIESQENGKPKLFVSPHWQAGEIRDTGKFECDAGFLSETQYASYRAMQARIRGLLRLPASAPGLDIPMGTVIDCPNFLGMANLTASAQDDICKAAVMSPWIDFDGHASVQNEWLVSREQLAALSPEIKYSDIDLLHKPLNAAMAHFDINTPLRKCHFLAQAVHESGYFKSLSQQGTAGNFIGRGLLQLTGRPNYEAFQNYLNSQPAMGSIDIVKNPGRVSQPDLAAFSAAWYWHTGYRKGPNDKGENGNVRADKNDFHGIVTDVIRPNPQMAHYRDRYKHLTRAFAAFEISHAEATLKRIAEACKAKGTPVA